MIFKMFGKGKKKPLVDLVQRNHKTGYLFVDVTNDLGDAAEKIMKSTNQHKMAYGYARRVAAAALYIQGLVKKDTYDYVKSIFKSLQVQTEHSVEFQEAAAADAVEFLQTYSPMVNSLSVKKIIQIAETYEIPGGKMSDAEFFKSIIDTLHAEQEQLKADLMARSGAGATVVAVPAIKVAAVDLIMALLAEQGANVDRNVVSKIVDNVAATLPSSEISAVGEKVLVVSVLANATGFFIDQGDIEMARNYYACIEAAIRQYIESDFESLNDHQMGALRSILTDYSALGEEIEAAMN